MALPDRFIVGGRDGVWLSDGTQAGTTYTLLDNVQQFADPTPAVVSGGKAYFTSSGNFQNNGPRNDIVWSSDGTLAGTVKVAEAPYLRWNLVATEGNTIVFSDQRDGGNIWRTDDAFATVQLVARRQPSDTSTRKLGIAGGLVYFSRFNTLQAADIYRATGNPDRPQYLTTVGTDYAAEQFVSLAGKMLIPSVTSGQYTVLTDATSDGSLQPDNTLLDIGILGSTYAEGSSFILGPSYFSDVGIELGRLERNAEITISNRYLLESTLANTFVGQLSVAWRDNADLQFALVDGVDSDQNSLFNVDAQGRLILSEQLDYEQSPIATIRVRASGTGFSVENSLVIFLGDVKDSVDDIAIAGNSVNENAAADTVVGRLTSSPVVAATPVTYSLLAVDGQSTNMAFAISGDQLVTTRPLDFESQRSYLVTVQAVDSDGFSGIKTLTINVLNVNENASALIGLSNDRVEEANSGDVVVGTLTVPGSTDTSWTFALSSGLGDFDNSLFTIDDDQLIITDLIDYETRDNYSIHITASSPQSGTVSAFLTIDITPVDEFQPLFIDINFLQGAIFENTPAGTPVLKLSVFDQDRGENYVYSGSISFQDGSSKNYFQIVGDQFVATEPFNFESVVRFSGVISVTATSDNGSNVSATRVEGVSFGTFLGDVNDAPEIAVPIADQIAIAGGELNVGFGFEDEDANDTLAYTATLNGSALPSWATLQDGAILFNPSASNAGSYTVSVTATDRLGASVTDTFTLTVLVPTLFDRDCWKRCVYDRIHRRKSVGRAPQWADRFPRQLDNQSNPDRRWAGERPDHSFRNGRSQHFRSIRVIPTN